MKFEVGQVFYSAVVRNESVEVRSAEIEKVTDARIYFKDRPTAIGCRSFLDRATIEVLLHGSKGEAVNKLKAESLKSIEYAIERAALINRFMEVEGLHGSSAQRA